MHKETAKQFLENNRDALLNLAEKIRHAELNSTSYEVFNAKKSARMIVENWISDIFNIAYSIDEYPTEEPDIFRRLDRERQEGRTDAY